MSKWVDAGLLSDMQDPGSRGCQVEQMPGVPFFVVHKDQQLHAYHNRCPHVGAPLEWVPDQFLDRDNSFIECAMHGALFVTDSGRCVSGPCIGKYLQQLPLRLIDDRIQVDVASLLDSGNDS